MFEFLQSLKSTSQRKASEEEATRDGYAKRVAAGEKPNPEEVLKLCPAGADFDKFVEQFKERVALYVKRADLNAQRAECPRIAARMKEINATIDREVKKLAAAQEKHDTTVGPLFEELRSLERKPSEGAIKAELLRSCPIKALVDEQSKMQRQRAELVAPLPDLRRRLETAEAGATTRDDPGISREEGRNYNKSVAARLRQEIADINAKVADLDAAILAHQEKMIAA